MKFISKGQTVGQMTWTLIHALKSEGKDSGVSVSSQTHTNPRSISTCFTYVYYILIHITNIHRFTKKMAAYA